MNILSCISIAFFLVCVFGCSSGEFETEITKRFTTYGYEESFEIRGETEASDVVFSYQGTRDDALQVRTFNTCLTSGLHYIIFMDSYGDGWGNGMDSTPLSISVAGFHVFTGGMDYYMTGTSHKREVQTFTIQFPISSTDSWKYTDISQTSQSWISNGFSDTEWSSNVAGSFPNFVATTRYYRLTLPSVDLTTILNMNLNVYANGGMVIYINGNEIYRNRLQNGDLNGSITATGDNDLILSSRVISFYKYYIPTSGSYTIAVEIHLPSNQTPADFVDPFKIIAAYSMRTETQDCTSTLFTSGTATSSPVITDPDYTPSHIFDENDYNYFKTSFVNPTQIIYTLSSKNSYWINTYSITSTDKASEGYPTSWTLEGTNNNEDFAILDQQENFNFGGPSVTKTFKLPHIYLSYNTYRLTITAASNDIIGIKKFYAYDCNLPVFTHTLTYPESSINDFYHFKTFDLMPSDSSFTSFEVSPSLPTGLFLNSINGRIYGQATSSVNQQYTITAHAKDNNVSSSFAIMISLNDCLPPNHLEVRLRKVSTNFSREESYAIFDATTNELLFTSPAFTDNSIQDVSICLSSGLKKIETYDTADDGWSFESYLLVQLSDGDGDFYTTAQVSASSLGDSTYYFSTSYVVTTDSEWKYTQGVVPSNWYGNTEPSGFVTYNHANPPAATSNVWLFRSSFTVSDKGDAYGLEIRLKVLAGYVIYINGNEVYRRYLPSGDITISTTAIGGDDVLTFNTLSSPHTYLTIGTNTISVGIINLQQNNPSNLRFSFSLQFLLSMNEHTRNFDRTLTAIPNGNGIENLIDQNEYKEWSVSTTHGSPVTVLFDHGPNRAEYINYHCITSSRYTFYTDPSDWAIYGSNDNTEFTLLGNVTNAYFSDRTTIRCFFIPQNTKPWRYYRFLFTEPAGHLTDNDDYNIGELTLLMTDLQSKIPPPLAFASSSYIGYVNVNFPEITPNSEYYTNFRITPALTLPLELDTSTGSIRGIPTSEMPATQYTITAMTPLGADSTTTLDISVVRCSRPNVMFYIHIHTGAAGKEQGFEFLSRDKTSLFKRVGLSNHFNAYYPFCYTPDLYYLHLIDNGYNGWDEGYFEVFLEDQTPILYGSLGEYEYDKEFPVSIGYVIPPLYSEWKYNTNSVIGEWTTLTYSDSNWSTAIPGSFESNQVTTNYFRNSFTIDTIETYASATVVVKTHYGFVVYLNGQEFYRQNLPDGIINRDTYALEEYSSLRTFSNSISISFGSLVSGANIIAIEVHKTKNANSTVDFDASLLVSADNSYKIVDGVASSQTPNDVSVVKAFDNTKGSTYIKDIVCSEAMLKYTYNNNKKEYISAYNIITGPNCNARHPSAWRLEASNDNINWSVLDIQRDQYYTSYYQQTKYSFYTEHVYNSYRMVVTQCNNTNIKPLDSNEENNCVLGDIGKGFQLSEFALYTTRVVASCTPTTDGFNGALEGQYAFKNCPQYYEGRIEALCKNHQLQESTSYCTPMKPYYFKYESSPYLLYVNEYAELKPTLYGAATTCTSDSLPNGLSFNTTTAVISGKISNVLVETSFRIICSNKGGDIVTSVLISSITRPGVPVWVWILLAVIIIIVIVIVVYCIYIHNKGKKTTHNKLDTKSKQNASTTSNASTKQPVKI